LIRELTAPADRCLDTCSCPGVLEDTSTGMLLIIGTKTEHPDVIQRVGPGETAITIDKGLVSRALAGPFSRFLMRVGL
jgi:hypothetical protein